MAQPREANPHKWPPDAAAGARSPSGARPVWRRRWSIVLAGLVVFAAIVHWGGGALAKVIINHKLAQMDVYTGRVGAVRLALWRGGAAVEDFVLRERDKPNEPPLVRVRHASLSSALRPLLRGKLGGEGVIEDVDILFAKHHAFAGPKDAAEKIGAEAEEKKHQAKRWQDILQQTLPIEVERFEMRNARVRYIDRAHQPNVDVSLRDLTVVVSGLQNRPHAPQGELPARVEMTGLTTGNGRMKLTVSADPGSDRPHFQAAFELKGLELPPLNTFMRAYASADVSRGTFDVYSEIKAADGVYHGYVKPFFHDLDFKNAADENKNIAERAKEKVVSAVSTLLKNEDKQNVATMIPFSGTLQTGDVGIWETVHYLLRNAFVQALREGLESQTPSS